jgi:hypothetical protein
MNLSPSGKELILVGLSINNRFFTEDNMEYLFKQALARHPAAAIRGLLVEEPQIHNYFAIGMNRGWAIGNLRKKGNALHRKAVRSLEALAATDSDLGVLHWRDSAGPRDPEQNVDYINQCDFPSYNDALLRIGKLYVYDHKFHRLIDEPSETAITKLAGNHPHQRRHNRDFRDMDVVLGSPHRQMFLFSELALLYAISKEKDGPTTYCYHKDFPPLTYLLDRQQAVFGERTTLGFELLSPGAK